MLLEVKNLRVSFSLENRWIPVLHDLSFDLEKGRSLCIVGESGCGKSVTALTIPGLLPKINARIDGGEVRFKGEDLTRFEEKALQHIRGKQISMVFQEPGTSLNPVLTVGYQLTEALRIHARLSRKAAREKAVDIMRKVGISSPEDRIDQYPHELSGGMKQRVMIAMALICEPDLLIADEPTTALDVTIQAQILDLIRTLRSDMGMSLILITHDLGIVSEMGDDVLVMYAGMVVEKASVRELFEQPRHPYTVALKNSLPSWGADKSRPLEVISGRVPSPTEFQSYCRFYERCPLAKNDCKSAMPELRQISKTQWVRCLYA